MWKLKVKMLFGAHRHPYHIEFVVLTAVVKRSSVFWDIMLCSPFKVNRNVGGICHTASVLKVEG
jgi:hypothetical protein